MSDLFSSLLHRHKGTCDVVKPRSRSRFETETTHLTIPFNQSDADGPGAENIDSRALVAQIPQHRLPDTKDIDIKPLQIEVQESRPDDQPLPPNPRANNLNDKSLIQPTSHMSTVEKINDQKIEPLTNTPVRDKHDEAPAELAPVGRTIMVEKDKTPIAEPKHRLDGNLGPQISAILDRMENLRSALPEPQEEHSASKRLPADDKAHAGDTLDEPRRRSRQQAPMNDGAERANGPSKKGPMRPETASVHRERPHNTLLALPSWFSRMEAQSMLPKNRPNGEPPPEKVINVTIGRIEVKATKRQETHRARKPQKPSGVMSLEKYLRQSERGGR